MNIDRGISAEEIITSLNLLPHPEGGQYVQTFRDGTASTAIYYLLQKDERSHWHRVHGSAEVWHYYAGSSIDLMLSCDGVSVQTNVLGPNIATGERPQIIVPAGCWQSAQCRDDWMLAGCTVAPSFDFANFEIAQPDWQPGQTDR